jgi:outer membrane protein assembly factor BamA
LGPDTRQSEQSRYGEDRFDGGGDFEWRFWRATRLATAAGFRIWKVYDGHYGEDPNLTTEAARGAFVVPAGFGEVYTAEYNRASLVVDTRNAWPAPGSGFRTDIQAEQGSALRPSPAAGWIRYGAATGGYLDLNQRGRVISLAVTATFVDPIGGQPIPFTELASLGGDGPMRGYYPGRLVDRSALTGAAHYVWPIGPWLDGSLEAAVGNVFGEHLQGFRPGRLRFSGDAGVSSQGSGDFPIELIVGLGSETFEHGATIDSIRVALSVNHGF